MELFKIGFVSVRLLDLIDISLVAFLLYKLYDILKGSLAIRVLWVVFFIFLSWKLVGILDLVLLKTILNEFWGLGAIGIVIIFAPEIRRFLGGISRNTLIDRFFLQDRKKGEPEQLSKMLEEALRSLHSEGHGALIVLAGNNPLREIRETGENLDAEITPRLIHSIFQRNSPLHDGAMIISGGRIETVRCILPISRSDSLPAELGLRHRSGIGVTETTDALAVILSEERGELSYSFQGKLHRHQSYPTLARVIKAFHLNETKNELEEIKIRKFKA